jgi:hypothetical protein
MSGTPDEQGAATEWESELVNVTTTPLLVLLSTEETVLADAVRRLMAEIDQSDAVTNHSVTAH